ncbi:hypothetical protein NM688_g2561 [Phlebia brevispora]|uniref:Uncharacterized protein n=1 Tax=Phlebia brevispora TaxID=194682 RepID=A0ACC1T8D3_9APHY|nr:hypothetical protein NM688_g2561 [Phlebia brevispora]
MGFQMAAIRQETRPSPPRVSTDMSAFTNYPTLDNSSLTSTEFGWEHLFVQPAEAQPSHSDPQGSTLTCQDAYHLCTQSFGAQPTPPHLPVDPVDQGQALVPVPYDGLYSATSPSVVDPSTYDPTFMPAIDLSPLRCTENLDLILNSELGLSSMFYPQETQPIFSQPVVWPQDALQAMQPLEQPSFQAPASALGLLLDTQ